MKNNISFLSPDHQADLLRSGLSAETIQAAGLFSVPLSESSGNWLTAGGVNSAYAIPYNTEDALVRYRLFYEDGQSGVRYTQPSDACNHLYLGNIDRSVLTADTPIYITEGEKKTLKGQQEGLDVVGLPGLWNWNDARGGLLADFEQINLRNRIVNIVPDNDWLSPNVPGYRERLDFVVYDLSLELQKRGSDVRIVMLPAGVAKGLDDYLCQNSIQDLLNLPTIGLGNEIFQKIDSQLRYQRIIDQLNKKHAVISVKGKFAILNEDIDPVSNRPEITFSNKSDFLNLYSNKIIDNPKAGNKGQPEKIGIGKLWFESENRREYKGIVFNPRADIAGYYNLWTGFPFEPKEGCWDRTREHILGNICSNNEEHFTWLLAWMARIVQDPGGERPGTAIVLRGDQGVGKGFFAGSFGSFLGNHYLQITQSGQVTGRFNYHLKEAILVFMDEITWGGDQQAEGILKGIITEPSIAIEPKGKNVFHVKNHINLIIASNNAWVIPAGLAERRFFVLDVSDRHKQDHDYFSIIEEELNNGGREAMLHYLMNLDISGINLRRAPRTAALLDQIELSMSSVRRFWFNKLKETDGENWLERLGCDDFYSEYQQFCRDSGITRRETKSEFGKALKEICPELRKMRARVGEKRKHFYCIPKIEECRAFFENLISFKVDWDS